MSSENDKNKNITRLAIILVVGLLIGGGAIYLAAPSLTSPSTLTLTQLQTQTQTVNTGTTVISLGTPTVTQTTTQTTTSTSLTTATAPGIAVSTVSTQSASTTSGSGWANQWTSKLLLGLVAEFPNSTAGPAAWNATAHPDVYVTSNVLGGGGGGSNPYGTGISIIDAKTNQVIVTRQYSIAGVTSYAETMGTSVSMDGQYIYLPTSNSLATVAATSGILFVIDARTLLVHQIISSEVGPHHCSAFRLYNGTDSELCYTAGASSPDSTTDTSPLQGTIWIMNPAKDNRVIGGITTATFRGKNYLSFPSPDGQHLFVDVQPDVSVTSGGQLISGSEAVVDMSNWHVIQYYQSPGPYPNWVTFTADGKFAYVDDSYADYVIKIDNVQGAVTGISRAGGYGPYGTVLNYNQTALYITDKGEGGGYFGKTLSEISVSGVMSPVGQWTLPTPVQTIDHYLLDPFNTCEIWGSSNAGGGVTGNNIQAGPYGDFVFNTCTNQPVTVIVHSGSSHNGAFVTYTVNPDGSWTGMLLSDHNGLHGSALVAQNKALGVTQIYYGSSTYKTEDQRVLPGEPV